ncbi:hypothetical protein OE88DRAFT_1642844 [Heliocybe sulcata]|uniref:GST N-terminal domain-containing protein n=1 Tax=Heliocybe sulcata TaxID=5364 RepID=A0A5C3NA88_9AGAM|nr:hypothetical protein OE88DRAFT_1642844 [Heliocybe sulcata]
MAPKEIILYDIPRREMDKGSWSPNTLKARLALAFKGLPYKTVWIEYPDIAGLCEKIGAKSTGTKEDGTPAYTLPVIQDPNTNAVVADSYAIAEYLDANYATARALFPAGTEGFHAAFFTAFTAPYGAVAQTYPTFVAHVPELLNPSSAEYFIRTRTARLGKLEDLCPRGPTRNAQLERSRAAFEVVAGWYAKAGKDKLYLMGDTPTWADIVIAAYMLGVKRIFGPDSDEWKQISSWHGGRWAKLVDALDRPDEIPKKRFEKFDLLIRTIFGELLHPATAVRIDAIERARYSLLRVATAVCSMQSSSACLDGLRASEKSEPPPEPHSRRWPFIKPYGGADTALPDRASVPRLSWVWGYRSSMLLNESVRLGGLNYGQMFHYYNTFRADARMMKILVMMVGLILSATLLRRVLRYIRSGIMSSPSVQAMDAPGTCVGKHKATLILCSHRFSAGDTVGGPWYQLQYKHNLLSDLQPSSPFYATIRWRFISSTVILTSADISITVGMYYVLRSTRERAIGTSRSLINTLITYAVVTGLLAMLIQIIYIIAALQLVAFPGTFLFQGIYFVLGKGKSYSPVNSREALRTRVAKLSPGNTSASTTDGICLDTMISPAEATYMSYDSRYRA